MNRTVFLGTIGVSFLGVNGLFASILGLLSLAELGIGSAIAYSLYEPVIKNDYNKVNLLMNLFARVYRIIACVIGCVGLLLVPVLPLIIKNRPELAYLKIYYLIMLAGTVGSYLFSYKRTLLLCDQKSYINDKNTYLFTTIQTVVQILLLVVTRRYLLYLAAATLCTVVSNLSISMKVNRTYSYLQRNPAGKLDEKTKKDITRNVIAIMFHKISGIIIYSSDNIIISTFIGINSVGIYSNYYMIIQLVSNLLGRIFNGITASVANLYVIGSVEEKRKAFHTIYFINFWLVSVCTPALYFLLDPFIRLWLGDHYLLDQKTTWVLVILFYHQSMRFTTGVFKSTAGLYWNDRYKAIIEAAINLGTSILLLRIYGITGVFLGTLISLIATSFWVEPYIVYRHILRIKFHIFFKTYCFYMMVCLCQITVIYLLQLLIKTGAVLHFIAVFFLCATVPNLINLILFHKNPLFLNAMMYAAPIREQWMKLKSKLQLKDPIQVENKSESKLYYKKGSDPMPAISIIIPVYNNEEFLSDCIESVLHQTLTELEIIIIDDGSTDQSLQICEDYSKQDKRILLIRQNNKGISSARNKGIKLATGDYLYFLDSKDKIFSPDTLYKMFSELYPNRCDILLGQVYSKDIRPVEYNLEEMNQKSGKEIMISLIKNKRFNADIRGNLYKRGLFHRNKLLFLEGTLFEEEDISPKLFYYAKKVGSIKEYCCLRLHGNPWEISGSQRSILKKMIGWIIVADQLHQFFLPKPDLTEEEKGIISQYCSLFYLKAVLSSYAIKNVKYISLMNKAFDRADYLLIPERFYQFKFKLISLLVKLFGVKRSLTFIRAAGRIIHYK